MKKIYMFMLMLLLIGQTILGPLGTVMAQDFESSSFSLKEGTLTGVDESGKIKEGETVTLEYEWSLSGPLTEDISKPIDLPEQLQAVEGQGGQLLAGYNEIGHYVVEGNQLIVTVNATHTEPVSEGEVVIPEEGNDMGKDADPEMTEVPETDTSADEDVDADVEIDDAVDEEITEEPTKDEPGSDTEIEMNKDTEENKGQDVDDEEVGTIDLDKPSEIKDESASSEPKTESAIQETEQPNKIEAPTGSGTISIKAKVVGDAEGTFEFGEKTYTVNGEEHGNGEFKFNLKISELTDLDGNPFSESNLLNPQQEFYLKLIWDMENGHNYEGDDTIVFSLPKGIKILETMDVELKDVNGQIVANAKINTDNTVELTFTDFVKENSNVNGYIRIVSKIDEENAEVDDGEIVLQPIGDEGEIRNPIDLGKREKTIEKKGAPNKGYNADEINWEVIINKHKVSLNDTKVTDVLPAGTEYKEGSLKVIKLRVDLNGNILGDLEEVDVAGETVTDGELSIPLGDINDAYRIEYVTTVTDEEKSEFTNDAILSDNSMEDISADATVTINRGEAIKKKVAKKYNPKTRIIEWEIEFNYNQKVLTEVTLKDAWKPAGKMHLVEESLMFQEVEIDENGKAHNVGTPTTAPGSAELVNGTDQFEVTGITTDKAYKITYQTKVNNRVLDRFDISNTAGFGDESAGSGTNVETHYGSKSAGTVDYKNKTIEWSIEINHDEYPMEKISVLDTLGDGLALEKSTIEIEVDGGEYKGNYTVSDGNPFELKFPNDFKTNKKIVITYKTKFVADDVTNKIATNKAEITWTPKDGTESITKEVKAETELNKETKDNSWKSGSYNPATKEITWTIYTNYRENNVGNLIVKDNSQGNQKIVDGSIIVTELSITDDGKYTEGEQLSDVANIDKNSNSLTVNIGNTNKAYKIEYKTSIADLTNIQKEYVNKAEVFDGERSLSQLVAKVGIAKANTYGEKSGSQDGKQIHWSVTVNPGQQKIENLKLEDEISQNQEYLIDTFKVYEASVDVNGKAKKGDLLRSDLYELTHKKGELIFTVEWKDTVERAFIVEYSTLFFAAHGKEVTNKYKVTGDELVEGGKTDGDGSVIIKQLASGGGSGEVGYLIVEKVGTTKENGTEKLSGVEFELIDPDTNKVLKSGATDSNGQIDFGRLLYGKYKLKEKVPSKYVLLNEDGTINEEQEISVEIKQPYNSGDIAKHIFTVTNHLIRQSVELTKVDGDNTEQTLAGVSFKLQKQDENGKYVDIRTDEDLKTNEAGKLLIEDLALGDYRLIETETLSTHWLDQTPIDFTIDENQTTVTPLKMKNFKVGNFEVKKVDSGDPANFLPGAEFELTYVGEGDKPSYTATTDENGIATFENVKYGKYELRETKAPEGYVGTGEVIFITVESKSDSLAELIKNEEIIQGVKLVKVDSEKKANKLAGAEFTLYTEDGEIVEENMKGEKVPTKTNNEGELIVNKLPPGKYYFLETKAPEHYILDADQENRKTDVFVIVKDKTSFEEVTMENKRGKGRLVITKQDAASSAALSDTEFELFNSANVSLGKKVTDANGKITYTDLPYDTYTLIETKAKSGYVPNSTEHKIVVSDADVDGKEFKKTITNKKIIRAVHLTKYNANKTLALPNAEFELRKMNSSLPEGYEVVTTIAPEKLLTDENGTIYLNDLPVGDYQFVETKAPSGYYVNKEPISFTITTYQTSTVYVDKTNHRIPDPVWPGPVEPGKPVDPDKPKPGEEDPNDPNKPGEPGEENPNDPDKPGKPGEEDPNDPNEPGQPGEEDPNDPNKPGQPGEEDPSDPNKPTDPSTTDPTDPNAPGKDDSVEGQAGNKGNATGKPGSAGGSKGQQSNASGKDTLPQTGEELYLYMTIFGFVLILAGGFMVRRRKISE